MTVKEMIAWVQKNHPHLGDIEIAKLINFAQDDLCHKTEVLTDYETDTTVADQRWYDLGSQMVETIKIINVWLTDSDGNYFQIPRLLGDPERHDSA